MLPAPQPSLTDFNPVHIDLFAAETALNVSEVYMLLGERLDPFLVRRVREELRRRTLEAFLARPVRGWKTAATNWTAVCTCGVAVALMNVFPEEAKALVPRFVAALFSQRMAVKYSPTRADPNIAGIVLIMPPDTTFCTPPPEDTVCPLWTGSIKSLGGNIAQRMRCGMAAPSPWSWPMPTAQRVCKALHAASGLRIAALSYKLPTKAGATL